MPGHFHQTLTLPGTPAQVSLTLSRDGHSLLSKTLAFTYLTSQPNGPECAPACHQASVDLTIGDDSTDGGSSDGPTADAAVE